MAFRQASYGASRRLSPAAVIGNICHSILDYLVRSREIWNENWLGVMESQWDELVGAAFREAKDAGDTRFSSPESWPQFHLKHSRLRNAGRRLKEILEYLSPSAVVLPEEPLLAADGRLYGRPDLLIREPGNHQVIEYKSGRILAADGVHLMEAYERQLQIYAYLEAQATGDWPSLVQLLPLEGRPLLLEIVPAQAEELVEDILSALDLYNSRVPGAQPAAPSDEVCSSCPHASECEAFWESCDPSWAPHITAIEGTVTETAVSEERTVSFAIDVDRGTLEAAGRVLVRNVDLREHPEVGLIRTGDYVRIAGLREESRYGTQALRAFSSMAVLREGVEVRQA